MWIITISFFLTIGLILLTMQREYKLLALYNLTWFSVVLLCGLHLMSQVIYSDRVYIYVLIGGVAFNLGYLCFVKVRFCLNGRCINENKELILNVKLLCLLLCFCILFYLIQAYKVLLLMRGGIPLSTIRYSYFTQGKIMNPIETIISSWITTPIVYYLIIPINIWNVINNTNARAQKFILSMSIANVVLYLFVTQAKQNLVYYIFSFSLAIFQFDIPRDYKRKIYKIVIIVIIGIFLLNWTRKGEFSGDFIYTYVGTSMNLLDHWTKYVDAIGQRSYGVAFLYGLINIPMSFIKLINPNVFPFFYEIKDLINYMTSTGIEVFQGSGPINNVYVTNLLFFYLDGGKIGIAICDFLFGICAGIASRKYVDSSNNLYTKIAYNILGVGVLYTFISWPLYNTSFLLSFIILKILMQKSYTRIKIM